MTKENAAQYLPLLQALADGKTIETRYTGDDWLDDSTPDWTLPRDCYRIKPEPREWWQIRRLGGHVVCDYPTQLDARRNAEHYCNVQIVRVREVLD